MTKLRLLTAFLASTRARRVTMAFAQIEKVIGAELPASARKWKAWWSNTGQRHARAWREAGFRTALGGAWPDGVVFIRDDEPALGRPSARFDRPTAGDAEEKNRPAAAILIGCVSQKLDRPAAAKDLYVSALFERRRRYAEISGRSWLVLSAKYGIAAPDDVIEPYNVTAKDLSAPERRAWAERVCVQLAKRFGALDGLVFEVHAGLEYVQPVRAALGRRGAQVIVPTEGLRLGEQLAWYDRVAAGTTGPRPSSASSTGVAISSPGENTPESTAQRHLAREITGAFERGKLDLSDRTGAPAAGWEGMPEFAVVRRLRKRGLSDPEVRLFSVFGAAMDRARDADRLWEAAGRLHATHRWCFDPAAVVARPFIELADRLREFGVSQRHTIDTAGWRTIAESLATRDVAPALSRAIDDGYGDVGEILAAMEARTPAGTPLFPFISGPKVGPMLVRMLAVPGGARLTGIETLPVAVDVQVRRVTEYLGVTETRGMKLEAARAVIQQAWFEDVAAGGAEGPGLLANTCAALDPALWFWGKWGCSFCERAKTRVPIHAVCQGCSFAK